MIDQGVSVALAAHDATRNGTDSHSLGTGGTEGVVELTQWFERMETVFRISNCSVENQGPSSLHCSFASALTWGIPMFDGFYEVAYSYGLGRSKEEDDRQILSTKRNEEA
ncbi:hypothetical protein Tco_1293759 [Tanacetum coccineum]